MAWTGLPCQQDDDRDDQHRGRRRQVTLAAHIAIWLFDQGRKVALLDTDEQATAAGWIERAEKGITVAKATTVDAILREWKKLQAGHEFIVADSPGSGDSAKPCPVLVKPS